MKNGDVLLHAVEGLTKSAALEAAGTGVRVIQELFDLSVGFHDRPDHRQALRRMAS